MRRGVQAESWVHGFPHGFENPFGVKARLPVTSPASTFTQVLNHVWAKLHFEHRLVLGQPVCEKSFVSTGLSACDVITQCVFLYYR